jgi:tetracenomycin A2 monooxygenase-dioxygenase
MAVGNTLAEARQLPLWSVGGPGAAVVEPSPELPCLLSQDLLEPLLRTAAVQAGADVRFDTELVSVGQSGEGVAAQFLSRRTGCRSALGARYLIAADGARSPLRETLGITRSTNGYAGPPSVNIYFRADLADVVRGREFNLCQITHPDAPGALASVDGRGRWVFMARGAGTDRDWPALLRCAVGVPAPDLEVLSVLGWQSQMSVADEYRTGRVFLAGDAAHVMPPFAANGANTGIADAHNLAWKLATVLRDQAGDALLDSYDAERRPVGELTIDQAYARWLHRVTPELMPEQAPELVDEFSMEIGYRYRSAAILPDGDAAAGDAIVEHPAKALGQPGSRAPHVELASGRSTLDLFGLGFVLLTGGDGQRWQQAASAAARSGLPVIAPLAGFEAEGLAAAYGIGPAGASLVRPDGFVGWRSPGAAADPEAELSRALTTLLGR